MLIISIITTKSNNRSILNIDIRVLVELYHISKCNTYYWTINIQLYIYILVTKSTKTMEQLDEHLSRTPQHSPPSFMQMALTLFLYFFLLGIGFVFYYYSLLASGLFRFLDQDQSHFGILIRYAVFIFLVESLILFSNYYFQSQLYKLLHQSLLKTALIPILLWGSILGFTFLKNINSAQSNIATSLDDFFHLSSILCWYSILSFIIAFYLKYQKKVQYYVPLLCHWLLSVALFYFLYN